MLDIGTGPALVLIPGIQGRWEWIAPTAHALARTFRVLTFSLPGESASGCPHGPVHAPTARNEEASRSSDSLGIRRGALPRCSLPASA